MRFDGPSTTEEVSACPGFDLLDSLLQEELKEIYDEGETASNALPKNGKEGVGG
jgi:hypothetical protein